MSEPKAVPTPTLEASISRAVEFLRRNQLPSGEFKVYMSPDLSLQRDCVFDSSPFPTALITYSLGLAEKKIVGDVLSKALAFLQAEMEGPGLWRYWTRRHPSHAIIPPDLDDTACASYVLRQHGIGFPNNRKHILANRTPEGLFYTWITARWPLPLMPSYWWVVFVQWLHPLKQYYFWKKLEPTRFDVDGVVNANVLLYLGERPETRRVVDYLIDIVRRGDAQACDGWYQNAFMLYYDISRNYHSGVAAFAEVRNQSIREVVLAAKPDGSIGGSVLNTALGLCALLYWRGSTEVVERAVRYLLDQQARNGSWARESLYFSGPKKLYGWGSEELVTGFCLEALLRYAPGQGKTKSEPGIAPENLP